MPQDLHLKWDDIHEDCDKLAAKIRGTYDLKDVKGIVAIARGGMIPAGLLSNALEIRRVSSVSLIGYQGKEQQKELKLAQEFNLEQDGKGWLFVDDLSDTGRSLKFLQEKFPKAKFVTLYAKPEGESAVDLFVSRMDQDTWLHFPWEQDAKGQSFEAG